MGGLRSLPIFGIENSMLITPSRDRGCRNMAVRLINQFRNRSA
jgi:hypothetical protein